MAEQGFETQEGGIDYITAVLANKALCRWLCIEKKSSISLRRTMLACEGLVINILYMHGMASNMVGIFLCLDIICTAFMHSMLGFPVPLSM